MHVLRERRVPIADRPASPAWSTRWRWIVADVATVVAVFALEVALSESIDGAPTSSEQWVVNTAAVLAAVAIPLAAGLTWARRWARSPTTPGTRPRQAALGMIAAGVIIGAVRVAMTGIRLVDHVRLDLDEPATTFELALQVVLAFSAGAALVALGVHRLRAPDRADAGA